MIDDAPWIRDAEINGMDDPPPVKCPVCGAECATIYKDINDDVVGCDICMNWQDADEWAYENQQAEIEEQMERRRVE